MNDLERSHAERYRLTTGRILLFNILNKATVQPFTSVYLRQKSELRPSSFAAESCVIHYRTLQAWCSI